MCAYTRVFNVTLAVTALVAAVSQHESRCGEVRGNFAVKFSKAGSGCWINAPRFFCYSATAVGQELKRRVQALVLSCIAYPWDCVVAPLLQALRTVINRDLRKKRNGFALAPPLSPADGLAKSYNVMCTTEAGEQISSVCGV